MTSEEFGGAYEVHFRKTVTFLMAKGLSPDAAQEMAQAAWTRGWERLSQLRDSRVLPLWLNRVALNLYRTVLRRELMYQDLARNVTAPAVNAPDQNTNDQNIIFRNTADPNTMDQTLAAIDARTILGKCKIRDRRMLRDYYLKGLQVSEIAARNGWRENTARVRLFRARQAARQQTIGGDYDNAGTAPVAKQWSWPARMSRAR